MMKRTMSAMFILVSVIVGCASSGRTSSTSTEVSSPRSDAKKVALASLIVRNYGIYGAMGALPPDLITGNLHNVLACTERIMGDYWTVTPVRSFVHNPDYTALAKRQSRANYHTPKVEGRDMPIFANDKSGLIKGIIGPDAARKLCGALSVDAIVLVYSEWSIQSGHFVPTVKALTRNCVAMYDKSGKYLFYGRKDTLGPHAIGGAFAPTVINEDTIGHWLEAYETGVRTVLSKHRRKLR